MAEFYPTRQDPAGVSHVNDPDYVVRTTKCFNTPEAHFCGANALDCGRITDPDKAGFVTVMMRRGATGLVLELTPDGARALANSLLACATDAERDAADAAAAQLAATLAKGKPDARA